MMILSPFVIRTIRKQSFPMMCLHLNSKHFCSQSQSVEKVDLNEEKFEEASKNLADLIENLKNFSPRAGLLSPDIDLHDKILDKRIKGLMKYQTHAVKYMFWLNWQYSAFRIKPIKTIKKLDQGIIDIEWQLYGKPGWMALLVFDLAKNMRRSPEEQKDDWDAMQGNSIFYLDKDARVYKQILTMSKQGNYRDIVRLPLKHKK